MEDVKETDDFDGDRLIDGTEISCGLNPLGVDTDGNGIADGQEVVKQQIRVDQTYRYSLDELGTLPMVEISGQGDFSQKINPVAIKHNKMLLDIPSLVGTPFEFECSEDMNFIESHLTFSISKSLLGKYNLEDLAIAWYDFDEKNWSYWILHITRKTVRYQRL